MQTAMCYLQMTRIVLPQMLERKKGAIINISSASGVIPVPLLTVYSGTKVQADSHLISHKDKDLLLLCQFLFFLFICTVLLKLWAALLKLHCAWWWAHSFISSVSKKRKLATRCVEEEIVS